MEGHHLPAELPSQRTGSSWSWGERALQPCCTEALPALIPTPSHLGKALGQLKHSAGSSPDTWAAAGLPARPHSKLSMGPGTSHHPHVPVVRSPPHPLPSSGEATPFSTWRAVLLRRSGSWLRQAVRTQEVGAGVVQDLGSWPHLSGNDVLDPTGGRRLHGQRSLKLS